jgi:hypothetical protein
MFDWVSLSEQLSREDIAVGYEYRKRRLNCPEVRPPGDTITAAFPLHKSSIR